MLKLYLLAPVSRKPLMPEDQYLEYRIESNWESHDISQNGTLFAIGVFDGVHIGHRFLIDNLRQDAKNAQLLSGIITFDPHPQSVLMPGSPRPWLSELGNRVADLKILGVDVIAVLSFTQTLSQLSAKEFANFMVKYLKMRGIIIGPDFSLGQNHEGTATILQSLGQQMSFSVKVIPPYTLDEEIISSTLIRQALSSGDMIKVEKLLGRRFILPARVISGDKRGRSMGFPTANLDIAPGQALPADGVYSTNTYVHGKRFLSATYIGQRPTFAGSNRTIETYLLDYTGSLYNEELEVSFICKLRDERHFNSQRELTAQINEDVEKIRKLAIDS